MPRGTAEASARQALLRAFDLRTSIPPPGGGRTEFNQPVRLPAVPEDSVLDPTQKGMSLP